MKNKEVIQKILAYHPQFPADYAGCDGYKWGDPEAECTGVAVALVPTVDVIRRAAAAGCNLLIVHEPLFYSGIDASEWLGEAENSVYDQKAALLRQTGMTIWRDHDHMHAHQPDSIFTGVIRYMGWEPYRINDPAVPSAYAFRLPRTTVAGLAQSLQDHLHLNGVRFVGKADAAIETVAIVGHLFPGFGDEPNRPEYGVRLIDAMEQQGIDAIVPGEIIEWTVLSYVRDAVALGKTKAVMNVGHFNWEELGMRFMQDWLQPLLGEALTVHYLPTGDLYGYWMGDKA